MDVAYNHTGEGNHMGPSILFRGIDNRTYYRTERDDPGAYINDTGCGNTVNFDHIRVRQLVLDSLDYWTREMGVDGFRFDLATIFGRRTDGFSATHPFLAEISNLPSLRTRKLIAEPWDPGPGGYQLGQFPPRWSEWNDRYRDTVRAFWRGDQDTTGELARRLHGSADLFGDSERPPFASVNFITAHDGFTLMDVVSYEKRHNEANGEENRDGHSHNLSDNHGVEGPTDDAEIIETRRRQRLNMIATLMFSQGTPMLLAGDEFGHTQHGNNNAYAQDNATSWLDWSNADEEFMQQVREIILLRHEQPLLRIDDFVHGTLQLEDRTIRNRWINKDGDTLQSDEWAENRAFSVVIEEISTKTGFAAVAILFNRYAETTTLRMTDRGFAKNWHVAFSSGENPTASIQGRDVTVPGLSVTLLTSD